MVRILIADGQPLVRKALRELAESNHDWEICGEADDGVAALHLACRERPDVAVVDVALPGLDGASLAGRLRDVLPGTGVLLFTMHDEPDVVAAGFVAGARGYVLKTDPAALVEAAITAVARGEAYLSAALDRRGQAAG